MSDNISPADDLLEYLLGVAKGLLGDERPEAQLLVDDIFQLVHRELHYRRVVALLDDYKPIYPMLV